MLFVFDILTNKLEASLTNVNIKAKLHPRNKHNQNYDFDQLCKAVPQLSRFIENKYGQKTLDFANPNAVKLLNQALLKDTYNIEFWDIPKGFLCPPIPGRADYIHYLADILKSTFKDKINHEKIKVLDIGTGASCIYPLLGNKIYGWKFVATDSEIQSIKAAKQIIRANNGLKKAIDIRHQTQSNKIFQEMIKEQEKFHVTLCNPPFHDSPEQANEGSKRKWSNLGKTEQNKKFESPTLNFAGRSNELWCKGGELAFIHNMVRESQYYGQQVAWFTSLVSKKDNVSMVKLALKKAQATQIKVVKMAQGQKTSRFVAWSFLTPERQNQLFDHE